MSISAHRRCIRAFVAIKMQAPQVRSKDYCLKMCGCVIDLSEVCFERIIFDSWMLGIVDSTIKLGTIRTSTKNSFKFHIFENNSKPIKGT